MNAHPIFRVASRLSSCRRRIGGPGLLAGSILRLLRGASAAVLRVICGWVIASRAAIRGTISVYSLRGLGALSTPDLITAAANKYAVPPSLALAVATRESGLNQSAVGTSGELGVFQIMPGTARDLGVDPSNLEQNVDGGVRYLSQLYQKLGDWRLALEAYNGGIGNVQRGTVSSAAQSYADALLGSVDVSGVQFDDAGASEGSPAAEDVFSGGLSTVALMAAGLAAVVVIWAVTD